MEEVNAAKNMMCGSEKAIKEMVFCISDAMETKVLAEMRSSDHFSLLLDVIRQLIAH
eukprot:m.314552 g.314552  ORF g.314552 m.314552 type:complete len:57 (+) comp532489_c0_seq1:501-671(+)